MRLVLVEEPPAELETRQDDRIVGMSPRACAWLEDRGIAFTPIFELARESELKERAEAYWFEQLAWLEQLDERFDFPAATLYAYHLKICLDVVYVRCFELDSALRGGGDELVLVTHAAEEPPLDETLLFRGPSVLSRVAPLFGLPLDVVRVERRAWAQPAPTLAARLRARLGRRVRRSGGAGPPGLLFLHEGYDMTGLEREARAAGARCVHADELELPSAAPVEATALDGLWEWPDGWFGASVSEILRPRFEHWAGAVVPLIRAKADALAAHAARERIDLVVTPFMVGTTDAAALRVGPTSVLVEHGDDVFAGHAGDIHNLLNYDHFFTTNVESAAYFEARAAALAPRHAAQVHVGSYRWRERAAQRRSRRQTGRELVAYVVAPMNRDTRYLNTATYSDTWYWQVQKAIVDVLAAEARYDVVVKLFPGDPERSAPLSDRAARLGLRVSTEPFLELLPSVGRAIVDFPSTALYELALTRTPFVGLYFSGVDVRPAAVERFGPLLRSFDEPAEAAAIVRAFLDDPDPAVADLEPEGPDLYAAVAALA